MFIYFMSISSSSNSMGQKSLDMFLRQFLPDYSPELVTYLLLSGLEHSGWQECGYTTSPDLKMEFSKGQGQGKDCRIRNIKYVEEEGKEKRDTNSEMGGGEGK